MFTRCPGCHTVHPLNAALLAQGNGLYRCAKCNKVSNALQNLFDSWPAAGDEAASGDASRQPPVLGVPLKLGSGEAQELTDEEAALLRDPEGVGSNATASRPLMLAAAATLAVLAVVNLFVVGGDTLLAQPAVRNLLEDVGLVEPAPQPPFRDLSLIRLASSEMHAHPTMEETLVLNATIVNRADRTQPFPALQVTLFDAHNQPLAARVFSPREYLAEAADLESGMSPGAYLPVIMELIDPGEHAVGFELKFH